MTSRTVRLRAHAREAAERLRGYADLILADLDAADLEASVERLDWDVPRATELLLTIDHYRHALGAALEPVVTPEAAGSET